jgi:hypothetical protein
MYFWLLGVEQLEIDPPEASLKRVEMRAEPGREIEAALPDEFNGDRSGPLFFPDPQNEEVFKEKLANCRALPLSSSSFKAFNGVYHLRMDRTGIPSRSYYALSLPKYAVPSQISVQDPRSEEMLDKYVVRDDKRKCFVIYIECQSPNGTNDFRLDIKFTIQKRPGIFENAEYPDDGHVKRYGRQIALNNSGTLSEQVELVAQLLSGKANHADGTMVDKQSRADGPSVRLKKEERCAKVIEEVKQIKSMYDHDQLTITEIREAHKDFEVWKIVESCLDPEGQDHFKSPGCWDREVVPYALSILSKEYKREPSTINDWAKKFRRQKREKHNS